VFGSLDLSPTTDVVYLCGNPNMIDEAFQLLVDAGFPIPQIRREKYISSH
jgi:NAD(P)H-flavin reductase